MTKILIVEDEPIIAEDLSMILRTNGYNVIGIAHNGSHALDILHNRKPDLALLDISLDSSMNGIELAQIINQKYKIPFIYITSFSDEHTLNLAKKTYPSGYIIKPFRKRDILSTIQIVLHRHGNIKDDPVLSIEELNQIIEKPLSEREYQILEDIFAGLTNLEISDKYQVSLNTVKTQIKRIYIKMNVNSRIGAFRKIIRSIN